MKWGMAVALRPPALRRAGAVATAARTSTDRGAALRSPDASLTCPSRSADAAGERRIVNAVRGRGSGHWSVSSTLLLARR